MKKLISALLAIVLVISCLAFTGCSSDAKEMVLYSKELEKIKAPTGKAETLVVAMSPDFAPMEFTYINGASQQIVGFDVLLANYLAKELGMNLEIKPMSFDATQTAVQSGNVDLGISGFSWTYERSENYEISDWYVAGDNETEQVIITTKANENKLATADSYKGLKIGYQGASLQQVLVEQVFTGVAELVPYVDLGTATEALKSGTIDALAVAKGNGEAIIANASETLAMSGYQFDVDEKYKNNVILIQKGDTELLAKVNAALAKAMENDYYSTWYDASEILAGCGTIDELGYDDAGNKITE